jgi:hypothetical protein
MIDLTYDYSAGNQSICECGDTECLGPADVVMPVVEALLLDSPILKLVKERNEAREMVKRMLSVADRGTGEEEYFKAMLAAFTAVQAWRGGAQ